MVGLCYGRHSKFTRTFSYTFPEKCSIYVICNPKSQVKQKKKIYVPELTPKRQRRTRVHQSHLRGEKVCLARAAQCRKTDLMSVVLYSTNFF